MRKATEKLSSGSISKIRAIEMVSISGERYVELPVMENEETRRMLISRMENIILSIIQQICSGKLPKVSYSVSTCEIIRDVSSERLDEEASSGSHEESTTTVDFASERSKNKLTLMITILARSHYLLITQSTRTRRSLYYDLQGGLAASLAPEQRYVDQAVRHVANLLKCSPWDLGLVATSKGLVAGNLVLSSINQEKEIDCNVPGGTSIPQLVSNVASLRTSADFVVLVEKDSVFQMLLDEDCPRTLNCLLVTGKGYPDVATRMLVKLLSEELRLPIYALVDADPFGVEIMCVYRFGSAALSREHENLVCSAVRWLGIHPSETIGLGVPLRPLTSADTSKLIALGGRPYINDSLSKELNAMRKGKAEIEAIASFSLRFLTTTYLPSKIKARDYL